MAKVIFCGGVVVVWASFAFNETEAWQAAQYPNYREWFGYRVFECKDETEAESLCRVLG